MNGPTALKRGRAYVGAAMLLVTTLTVVWGFAPGLPVLFAPSADAATRSHGRDLFCHTWKPNDPLAHGDGLGPVFNDTSCVACHFQGGVGGGGPNSKNVVAFEAHPTVRRQKVASGVLHHFATDAAARETHNDLRSAFPVEPGSRRVIAPGCEIIVPDFDPVRIEMVNTTALFGAGWVDRLPTKSITAARTARMVANIYRELQLDFEAVSAGRPHILPDGRVGKFGWKAQFGSLEEFVAAACANEIGLGTPTHAQPKPIGRSDAPEVAPDLDWRQFRAMTAYVDTLPRPIEITPSDRATAEAAERGRALFTAVGCAICHTPDIGGVHGVYSDFLLHRLDDPNPSGGGSYGSSGVNPAERPLPTDHPRPWEWKTPPLWGVADSAPYLHDGRAATLADAIRLHRGDAATVTEAYLKLPESDRWAVLTFLGTLKAPQDADQPPPEVVRPR